MLFDRFGPGRGFNCLITEATHIERQHRARLVMILDQKDSLGHVVALTVAYSGFADNFPVLSHDGVLDDSARLKSNRMSDVRSPAIP
jgi:hypothetical protein